jgi:3-oxoisoapionate kinase
MLAFYADDFTGATDALESIVAYGAKAVLFTNPPTTEQLNQFPDINVFGVAGKTRALDTVSLENELINAFQSMQDANAQYIHYKVCSTFDSAPNIGSIGKAIDCGALIFSNKIVTVIGGAPHLGRYCFFGNLFAQMGIGSSGKVYRLDVHPSISKHPTTPMTEANLVQHLALQTNKKVGLINWMQLQENESTWEKYVTDEEVIVFDVFDETQYLNILNWINNLCKKQKQTFIVGPSSVEKLLGPLLFQNGNNYFNPQFDIKSNYAPILVVSGSCSPVTKKQIETACQNDFVEIIIDINASQNLEIGLFEEVLSQLLNNKNVIIQTGEKNERILSPEILGNLYGKLILQILEKTTLSKLIVCGGDTSSYTARALHIDAVEVMHSKTIGAPLCKAYSNNILINGLHVIFKGGQVGDETFFITNN